MPQVTSTRLMPVKCGLKMSKEVDKIIEVIENINAYVGLSEYRDPESHLMNMHLLGELRKDLEAIERKEHDC